MPDSSHKPLTIAMINDAVTDCVAGSFISTRRFAKVLSEHGHRVVFIAARAPHQPTFEICEGIDTYRFRSILLPKSEGQLRLGFTSVSELIEIFQKEQIDIVHAMIPTPLSRAAMKAARSLDIPVVVHSHTQPENIFLHMPEWLPLRTLNRLFYRHLHALYNRADAIVFPSGFAQKRMHGLTTKSQVVISNGVSTERFRPLSATAFEEKYAIPPDKKKILYLGRLHPEKSVDTLFYAFPHILQRLPDAHLIIAGFGHLEPSLQRLATTLGVQNHVTFCGRLTDDEVVEAYNAADLYVLPSLAELEGMSVLEAMACGAPIAIANAPESAATHFVEENGLLFTPRDAGDLADKVSIILSDDALRASYAQASLAKSKSYTLDASARALESLYYSLIHTP